MIGRGDHGMDSSISNSADPEQGSDHLMDIAQLRDEFKRLRRAHKLSQVYVANMLQITQAALSAWETGKNQSLRTPALNGVIHLVGQWRADTNIVQIPAGRIRTSSRGDTEPDGRKSSSAREQARTRMVKAVRSKLRPDAPSAAVLDDLGWNDILDAYILSKFD